MAGDRIRAANAVDGGARLIRGSTAVTSAAPHSGQTGALGSQHSASNSRKTYYKWEQRGLAAMLEGLHERSPGRPRQEPDPEAEALRQRVLELEKELDLHKQSKALRDRLRGETGKKE